MEDLLPAVVAVEEAFDDPPGAVLYPEEEAFVARAVDKRRREFTTVRLCARAALARIGAAPVPLVPGQRGAPTWPAGVVGSMTHCAGYRAAAVARADQIVTIGVDGEPNEPLPDGVLESVSSAGERATLARLTADHPEVCWDRLLFSAKEAVYKAWSPLTGRWLGFEEASVAFDADTRGFTARLLVPGPVVSGVPLTGFTGRWLSRDGLVLTAIALPAGGLRRNQPVGVVSDKPLAKGAS
jgi:4'-phosphopantetheinyl transferase EntD